MVIEEKIDDDDVLKPEPVQHHNVDIEEFEETDIVPIKDTDKGTVQLPEDIQETRLESPVQIEEISEEYPTKSEKPCEIIEEEEVTTNKKSKKRISKKKQKSMEETLK